jgi:glycosyltransferase involved in cell wall biosynthesis
LRTDSTTSRVALVANWDWVLFNFRLPVARALRARGCDVILVCPPGQYAGEFTREGFAWVPWPLERRSTNAWKELVSIWRLARIYRRYRPHLVHHFTIKPNVYGSIAAVACRVPAIINTFSGLGYLFSEHRRARLLRMLVAPGVRWASRRGRTWTVFQTEEDRTRVIGMGWAAPERSLVVAGSGVDLEQFRVAREQTQNPPMVVLAARLLADKGIAEFVSAARRLKERGVTARFLVAGRPDPGNPSNIAADILAMWEREGVVHFVGHQPKMHALLQEASIAVLPSYYAEGVPKFLLEAAATGLPIVATEGPGSRRVVRHGVNGFLVPKRDIAALADAIERLLGDPALRRAFGAHSREVAEGHFDQNQVVADHLAFYRRAGLALEP